MIKNLRKLRQDKGITQQQLADVLGSTQQTVNRYENQTTEPDIYVLAQLADYFDTTIDYLVGHTPPGTGLYTVEELDLNKEETELIQNYRQLSNREKASIRLVIRNYLKNR